MSIKIYSCLLNGNLIEYQTGEDGLPIEWNGANPASEHSFIRDITPNQEAAQTVDATRWYINVGPFFDRFGQYKYPILASSDPLIQAIIKDCSVRKYIDLHGRKADITQAVGIIQSKGFAINLDAIVNTIPREDEVYNG